MRSKYWKYIIFIMTLQLVLIPGCSVNKSTEPSGIVNKTVPKLTEQTKTDFDTGFLSGIPCSAPCFFNSTPGITTKDELIKNMEKYQINPSCTEKQLDDRQSVSNCNQGFFFWFYDNKLTEISIEPTSKITLGQVIEKYGSPEEVNYSRGGINELNLDKLVYFESYQFILHFTDPGANDNSGESQNFELLKDSIVLWIDYVDKDTLKTHIDNCTIPWKGYGTYVLNSGC